MESADAINKHESEDKEKPFEAARLEEAGATAQHHALDRELERRVVKKLDRHIIPLVLALCK
jgi:hypothetical protein